jgi:hypothetical protein
MAYLCLLIAGSILLFTGLLMLGKKLLFLRKGIITIATVISMEETVDGESEKRYRPFLQYSVRPNVELVHEYPTIVRPDKWAVGRQVKLVYNPARPLEASVLDYFHIFTIPFILIVVSLPVLLIGSFHYLR